MDDSIEPMAGAASAKPLDPAMPLLVSMLRELEVRSPGFKEAVRQRLRNSAVTMERSDEAGMRDRAPDMQKLAESWIFTE